MASHLSQIFAAGQYVDAVVSYVEGPEKFFVQPLVFSPELRALAKRLQVMYSTELLGENDNTIMLDHLIYCLRTNTLCWCAAPFPIGTSADASPIPTYYYRAIVVDRTGPSNVKVFFVDYGNTAIVPFGTLKLLPASFSEELQCMAVPCRLIEESGNAIDPDALRSLVDGFHVVVHVSPNHPNTWTSHLPFVADPLWVSLHITDGKEDVNVAEALLTNGCVYEAAAMNSH